MCVDANGRLPVNRALVLADAAADAALSDHVGVLHCYQHAFAIPRLHPLQLSAASLAVLVSSGVMPYCSRKVLFSWPSKSSRCSAVSSRMARKRWRKLFTQNKTQVPSAPETGKSQPVGGVQALSLGAEP